MFYNYRYCSQCNTCYISHNMRVMKWCHSGSDIAFAGYKQDLGFLDEEHLPRLDSFWQLQGCAKVHCVSIKIKRAMKQRES